MSFSSCDNCAATLRQAAGGPAPLAQNVVINLPADPEQLDPRIAGYISTEDYCETMRKINDVVRRAKPKLHLAVMFLAKRWNVHGISAQCQQAIEECQPGSVPTEGTRLVLWLPMRDQCGEMILRPKQPMEAPLPAEIRSPSALSKLTGSLGRVGSSPKEAQFSRKAKGGLLSKTCGISVAPTLLGAQTLVNNFVDMSDSAITQNNLSAVTVF